MAAWVVAQPAEEQVPERQAGELQGQVLQSRDLACLVRAREAHLLSLIHRKQWDRLPRPDGRVGVSALLVAGQVEEFFGLGDGGPRGGRPA